MGSNNLDTTEYLQKAYLKIRYEDIERSCNIHSEYLPDQHMCIGGIIDNLKYGKSVGGGGSWVPAICRDENGFGVLYGITSLGVEVEDCSRKPSNETCQPSVYADVSHFRSWIIQEAGAQKFHIPPLYGMNSGDEMAQVKIISGDGIICGGTLVSAGKIFKSI